MTPSDLTAELPAPRDDEPASLRADIVDELADHLQCAVRREQLRSGDKTAITEPRGLSPWLETETDGGAEPRRSQVYQRVLARFGDPAAVARKLWWDHMRERIMGQRITAIMAGIGAAACVAACVFLWQFVQDSRASQAASLAEMRDFNAKLLAGLQRPAEAPAESNGWAKVRVKLVDAESGEPVDDATVKVGGTAFGSNELLQLERQPLNGAVDFGSVPPGHYHLSVESESYKVSLSEPLLVGPGHAEELVLRVPRVARLTVEKVDWNPPEPIDDRLRFVLSLSAENQQLDGHSWMPNPRSVDLVIDGKGNVLGAVRFPLFSTSHAGYRVPLINLGQASPIARTTLSVSVIQVLQPIDTNLVESQQSGEPGTRPLPGHQLLMFNTSLSVDVEKTAEGLARLRPALTPQFWNALAHAEVLAGLKPPPDGMQLVTIPVAGQPDSELEPGRAVSIQAIWDSVGSRSLGGLENVQIVQSGDFAGFDPDSISQPLDQKEAQWNWNVLVTIEEADMLELAQRVPQSRLIVNPAKGNDLNRRSVATDDTRQLLQQAIDGPKPVF